MEQAEQLNATKQALRKTLLNYLNSAGQDLLTREAVVKVYTTSVGFEFGERLQKDQENDLMWSSDTGRRLYFEINQNPMGPDTIDWVAWNILLKIWRDL